MSMSANFHNLKTIELSPLNVPGVGPHPMLALTDDRGNHIAVHLTDENVESLAVAIEAYRAVQDVAVDDGEVAALKRALEPFARVADESSNAYDPDRPAWGFNNATLEWGDFYRARSLISGGAA